MNPHPLHGARKRIERADKHLRDFISEVEAYAASEADNVVIEYDADRNEAKVILAPKTPLPDELALIVSDCIHNLRAAVDYVVYELSRLDSSDPDPDGTQFPITTEGKFIEHRKARLKNNGPLRYLSEAHVNAIELCQPYKGSDWAKTLRNISNPDKHRKLIEPRSGRRIHIIDAHSGKAFKDGRAHRELKAKVSVRVFFRDGTPVVETLQMLESQIAFVIDSFESEFKV